MRIKGGMAVIVRIFVGLVFVFSAVTKYISIEAFDMFVFEHGLFSWVFTTFATRILISFEAVLGLLLFSGIYLKFTRVAAIGVLVLFTLYVALKPYVFPHVGEDNCHCFGTVLLLSDNQTIIKNLVLLALSPFLFFDGGWRTKKAKLLVLIFSLVSLSSAFIIRPPDVIVHAIYGKQAELDEAKFNDLLDYLSSEGMDVKQGKKVLCLYAPICKHCQRTAIKLNVMINRHSLNKACFVNVFWGSDKMVDAFYKRTKVGKDMTTCIVPAPMFLSATKGKQPVVVLLDNGRIDGLYKSTDLNEAGIVNFLK